ncbi:DUF2786 domain-containing protein [Nocardia sp. NPDC051030]|uniref:DUF2786 domain-containing protein n=1 Tax=Nocardia sp. NPDC051030 TaxID=3155162 RepID=UPI0034484CE7
MTPEQARDKVAKLRAHAASVAGTPEADLFYAKANDLAHEHSLPLTPPPTPSARSTSTRPDSAKQPTATTMRRTTMDNTATTAKPRRAASDGTMRHAFTPRTRAAFGRTSEPGTEVTGRIIAIEEEPDLDFHTKAPKLNADGTEHMIPVLILQTDGTTKPYGAGLRKLWMRTGIADAIIGACYDTDVERPAIGGALRIRYEGLGEPPATNFAAPKLYTATYQPPDEQQVRR